MRYSRAQVIFIEFQIFARHFKTQFPDLGITLKAVKVSDQI